MPAGITVIAYINAKAGHRDEVRRALLDLVAQTRTEKGCINYDVHQSLESTTRFAIYENWNCQPTSMRTPRLLPCETSPELQAPSWSVPPRSLNGLWFQNSATDDADVCQHSHCRDTARYAAGR